MILQTQSLSHTLSTGEILAFPDITLEVGERVALVGPSGSGKTTLLNLLTGIIPIQAGSVIMLNHVFAALSSRELDHIRATHIGLLFQTLNLLPYLDAATNVALGVRFSAARRARVKHLSRDIEALFQALGLGLELLSRPVNQLSTGQQQRVAAARALLGGPELIIADEPTSALDPVSGQRFLDALFSSMDRDRQAALVVTHDPQVAKAFDRQIVLHAQGEHRCSV
ncbi:MAG: ATP-binding cassette domain-containing protein [Litorivicinaceae bacterium]|nr:ATP-binding cassette domain-containing protein [Litorivicinaceae bacterium]MDP5328655.1 ATP-binding cassette domain-containing protein [Litorivicinaceae bacterium]MDP5330603.1 ATP-binding cassette domain-containing protein [Litorivicinaceae bacterium]MDP5340679.1 ATP-binding cassette domain-containing protein [Litorivicinaceae bacterium]MDP5341918.1 ATP-binding cassette domain-containing protein [Litorivicinaceae bacterium]